MSEWEGKLTNKAELEQIERDIKFIYKNIESCALNGDSEYSYRIDHLSKQGQKMLKHTLKADGYEVKLRVCAISGSAYYIIIW